MVLIIEEKNIISVFLHFMLNFFQTSVLTPANVLNTVHMHFIDITLSKTGE